MNLLQKCRGKSGQSTVEYILLVTAVIAVMIFFATGNNRGIQQRLSNSYNQVGDNMAEKASTLKDSHNPPAGAAKATDVTPDADHKFEIPKMNKI